MKVVKLEAIPVRVPYKRVEASSDRKSTRLNSSHLGISYAVFCLKKKTVEPVGDEEDHGALGEDSPRPEPVEVAQARAEPGAAAPVHDLAAAAGERLVDGAMAQGPCHI